jgi:endo-1,4-beta-D-glucanase Y
VPGVRRQLGEGFVTAVSALLGGQGATSRVRAALLGPPEVVGVVAILLIAALAHGVNMGNFPYYENDEGIYVSQAWAVVNQGTLAPYTYFYDHAPAGWLQMAAWSMVSGGFYALGTSIETGRGFMLVVQVVSAGLVYLIARRLTGSVALALAATAAYALSAYGIYYHRRVLLDNLATVWLLASLALLLRPRLSLSAVWLAAAALGISILSKELTIFVVPAMGLLVFVRIAPQLRLIATTSWFVLVGSIVSMYVLMAALKGELLPAATRAGEEAAHVSLLGTLAEQAARGRDGGILDSGSQFWQVAAEWAGQEPLLIVGGTAAAVVSVLILPWRREAGALGLVSLSLWLFVGRGGVVLPFYAVPLLPLLAVNLVAGVDAARLVFRAVARRVVRRPAIPERGLVLAAAVALVAAILPGYTAAEGGFARDPLVLWRGTEAVAQRDALSWVRDHLPSNAAIAIDRYLWTDLQAPPSGDEPTFVLAHDYRKIDADPYIRRNVFEENWRNFDYLVFSGQLVHDVQADDLGFLQSILDHSTPVATFDTGGWPIYVHRVFQEDVIPVPEHQLLGRAWTDYLDRFVTADGRVVADDFADRGTTSEGQAYAMLRAVYTGDRAAFDLVWGWTQEHLQRDDGLLSWRWNGEVEMVTDESSAPDAEIDASLALLFASRAWNEPAYAAEADAILDGIWDGLLVDIDGSKVLVAGDWAVGDARPVINPSYFAPYAFRIFGDVQPERDWLGLVDSSYDVLAAWSSGDQLGAPVGALPNWMAIDRVTGDLWPAIGRARSADEFSYDSSRVIYRLALDWLWFGDERALEAIKSIGLPLRELTEKGTLAAAYRMDGAPAVTYEASSMYAGVLPAVLAAGDRDLAVRIHSERILGPSFDERSADWTSYYAQNWAWFATALLDGGMANLWAGETTAPWRVQP